MSNQVTYRIPRESKIYWLKFYDNFDYSTPYWRRCDIFPSVEEFSRAYQVVSLGTDNIYRYIKNRENSNTRLTEEELREFTFVILQT